MSTDKWSLMDELQRAAETYVSEFMKNAQDASITDLFDMVSGVAAPSKGHGFQDVVDDPRAQKETPVANSRMTRDIRLYTCPACQLDVGGSAKLDLADAVLPPTLNEQGNFYTELKLVGVRADRHDCTPKVTR